MAGGAGRCGLVGAVVPSTLGAAAGAVRVMGSWQMDEETVLVRRVVVG
jgi:hypothetical protein